jgi:hypothetical protein
MTMQKVIRIGKGTYGNVYCKIEWNDGRLSISGVEGPMKNGNARGGCGQINPLESKITEFAPGWDLEKMETFVRFSNEWHLNDLQAGCEHQRRLGWDNSHINNPCPVCGYKYGTQWLTKEVPQGVIEWLFNLPETDMEPAWV